MRNTLIVLSLLMLSIGMSPAKAALEAKYCNSRDTILQELGSLGFQTVVSADAVMTESGGNYRQALQPSDSDRSMSRLELAENLLSIVTDVENAANKSIKSGKISEAQKGEFIKNIRRYAELSFIENNFLAARLIFAFSSSSSEIIVLRRIYKFDKNQGPTVEDKTCVLFKLNNGEINDFVKDLCLIDLL